VVRVRDLPLAGRRTYLAWHKRRFPCEECGRTFTERHLEHPARLRNGDTQLAWRRSTPRLGTRARRPRRFERAAELEADRVRAGVRARRAGGRHSTALNLWMRLLSLSAT
jgi:transposase